MRSLAFSPNGTSLVSGSDDKTIKLWDVQTGGVVKTFHGHTDWVLSVSISADSTMIASGSRDETICLWDVQMESCHCVMESQGRVECVRFSPMDPKRLASASGGEVKQWETNGHQINPTHNGSHIAFSLDGTQFVSCQGKDIVVRNTDSEAFVAKFHMANSRTSYCCFSPDGRLVAVAAGHTAYIWDTTSSVPHPIRTFIGHTREVTSLAFSSPSTLVTSSEDQSVKFWQIGALSRDSVVAGPKPTPLASASIKSIRLQVKDAVAISSHSDGMVRVWDISTGLCKASFNTPATNTRWGDDRLIGNKLISVWDGHKDICVWDSEKEKLQLLNATLNSVHDIKISEDGSKVFCLRFGSIQAWSTLTGGVVTEVWLPTSQSRRSLTVDGSRIWVHSFASKPLGWDFGIPGSYPIQLSHTSLLHPNNTKLWDTPRSRLKDKVSGKVVFQLAGRFAKPVDAQWGGQYLVAGYMSGEVLILDFNHMFPRDL